MKVLLILVLLFVGCDNHKKLSVYRSSKTTNDVPTKTRTDTVITNIPCPPCVDYSDIHTLPKYFVIMIDEEYFNVVSNLLSTAKADKDDVNLHKNLWDYIMKRYPEVISNESWTLIKSNRVMYLKRQEPDDTSN